MILSEALDQLDAIGASDERAPVARRIMPLLSGVSKQTLVKMQTTWDHNRPFAEFVAEQNRLIRECVMLETSETGDIVRVTLGMAPLTMATVITD